MKIILYTLICFILVATMPMPALCGSDSAENHVKDFYRFYIESDTNITIHSDLTKYVDGCMLKSLRIMYERSFFETDYFTKSQDIWKEWLDVLVVHKEIKVNNTTSIVPITFKFAEDKQHHLIVFVNKEVDGWRIIKVAGTEYFYE